MYAFAAALPPVAVLVLAAGSLVLRRRRRPKASPEKDASYQKVAQTPEIVKPKAKKTRKRSKRSLRPTTDENEEDGLVAREEVQQPDLQLQSERKAVLETEDVP